MEPTNEVSSRKDVIALAVVIVIAGMIFLYYGEEYFPLMVRYLIGINLLISFVAGMVAKDRRIGFGLVFFLSIFLSPLVGFILAFTSRRVKDEEFNQKLRTAAYNNSIADQLLKLNELKKEGILTPEEFDAQKARLLAQQDNS